MCMVVYSCCDVHEPDFGIIITNLVIFYVVAINNNRTNAPTPHIKEGFSLSMDMVTFWSRVGRTWLVWYTRWVPWKDYDIEHSSLFPFSIEAWLSYQHWWCFHLIHLQSLWVSVPCDQYQSKSLVGITSHHIWPLYNKHDWWWYKTPADHTLK